MISIVKYYLSKESNQNDNQHLTLFLLSQDSLCLENQLLLAHRETHSICKMRGCHK